MANADKGGDRERQGDKGTRGQRDGEIGRWGDGETRKVRNKK